MDSTAARANTKASPVQAIQNVNPYQSPQSAAGPPNEPQPVVSGEEASEFRPASTWANVACIGLGINAALAATALCLEMGDLFGVAPAKSESLEAWQSLLWSAMYRSRIATAIPFLGWEYRAYRNLPALGHQRLDAKFLWVILCWFVPIMNWFCPLQVMNELYQHSHPLADGDERLRPIPGLLAIWWGTWLVTVAISLWERFLSGFFEVPTGGWLGVGLDIAYLSATIVSAVLAIRIIRSINRHQLIRFAQVQELQLVRRQQGESD